MAKEKLLAGVKSLDFADVEPKVFGAAADWPPFVQKGLELLRVALEKIGINLDTENIPSADALIERLIVLVEASPVANWQKWLVLACLKYLHGRVHKDELVDALKGAV